VLLADLERAGVKIDPSQSGGFANRNIAGTSIPSQHAFGRAVDVNWRDNPRGPAPSYPALPYDMYGEDARQPTTQIHPEIARDLAQRHGFVWGGNWNNPDPMHFEVARGDLPPVPVQNRAFTAYAGSQPAQPAAGSPQPPPVTPPPPAPVAPPSHATAATNGVGPFETTTTPEPQSNPYADALSKALMKFEPETARPVSMGLLASLGPPIAPASSGWVSNPLQQRRPGMARAQFGLT
jgi:hypothetical protein